MTRTIIITGATSGLGRATASHIAATPDVRLIIACRNMEKARATRDSLIMETGNGAIEAMHLDLASLASVRQFAADYRTQNYEPLFCLVNNAGVGGGADGTTEDGFDVIFQTNHLGQFLLTNLLLSDMDPTGRILTVSSDMHDPPFDDFDWVGVDAAAYADEKLLPRSLRYSYSKLLNVYFVHELDRRLRAVGSKITANAFNPGFMPETNLSDYTPEQAALFKREAPERWGDIVRSPLALAELATTSVRDWISGCFFDRSVNVVRTSALSYSEENAIELWERSIELSGLSEGEGMLF